LKFHGTLVVGGAEEISNAVQFLREDLVVLGRKFFGWR
jgi:hypothetical protein